MKRLLGLLVTFLFAVILFGAGYAMGRAATPTAVAPPPAASTTTPNVPQFKVFWEAWDWVNKDFYDRKAIDPQKMTYGAIKGMLESLGDNTTVFAPPVAARREQNTLQGNFGGVGMTLGIKDKHVTVVSIIENTPAQKAGILSGDIVFKVDGVELTGLPLDEAVDKIRGPVGSKVTLTILRQNEPEPLVFELVRAQIALPSVTAEMKADHVGYIALSSFAETSPQEIIKAIRELRSQGAQSLILDLRYNLGGYLHIAQAIASQFLKEGVVVIEEDGTGLRKSYPVQRGGIATDIPLVVLVNRWSASASEIVAGAIQDAGRAPLIGEKTFGKGTVQRAYTLSDGSSVHITIAHWLTPKGNQIHSQGLTPNIEVPLTEEDQKAGRDPQLDRAITYLKTGK